MENKTIKIQTDPPYDVVIGRNLLDRCGELIRDSVGLCRLAVISDSTVTKLYLSRVTESLTRAGYDVVSFSFLAGEKSKNIHTLGAILNFLAENRITRSDCVVALGGGVCGDIAGFAAGCYLRGIPFVQLPTTLLAAVDSSVGGKTAIDLPAGKNLAGLFHQPAAVFCDTGCIAALPTKVFAEGAAEAIKTGILGDETLFAIFEKGMAKSRLGDVIADAVTVKGRIVAADTQEQSQRKVLNLGHTAGHAIEKCSNFTIPHGEAVAMGTVLMARAALKQGHCSAATAARIEDTMRLNGLPVAAPFSGGELAQAALSDKKRSGDKITVVFPMAIGRCTLETIPVSALPALFEAGLNRK